jgi:hypothetical protein
VEQVLLVLLAHKAELDHKVEQVLLVLLAHKAELALKVALAP